MSESPKNLVELYLKSCETFASKPLFGTKKTARGIGSPSPSSRSSSIESAAPWPRRESGPETGSPSSPTTRVEWAAVAYATYGREAAAVPMYQAQRPANGSSSSPIAVPRRPSSAPRRASMRCRKCASRLPALTTVVGLDRPPGAADSFAAFLELAASTRCRPRVPSPGDHRRLHLHLGTTGQAQRRSPQPRQHRLEHRGDAVDSRPLARRSDAVVSALGPLVRAGLRAPHHGRLRRLDAINDDLTKLLANMAEIKPTILVAVPRIFNRIYEAVNHDIAARPMLLQRIIRNGIRSATRRANGKRLGPISRMQLAFDDKVVFSKVRERFGGRLRYVLFRQRRAQPRGRRVHRCAGHPGLRGLRSHRDQPGRRPPTARGTGAWAASAGRSRAYACHRPPGDRQRQRKARSSSTATNVMVGYHNRPEENAAVFHRRRRPAHRRSRLPRRGRLPLHQRAHQGAVQAGERQVRHALGARGEPEDLAVHRQRHGSRRRAPVQCRDHRGQTR